MKFLKIALISIVMLGIVGVITFLQWKSSNLAPMPAGEELFIRWDQGQSLSVAIKELEEKKVVKNADVFLMETKLSGKDEPLQAGTYKFKPGMSFDEIHKALSVQIVQMVRIPEGRWIAWVGEILEEKGVCKKDEYIELAHSPEEFQDLVSFSLPKESLEGYLFPDTYDFPPLLGARGVIERQLKAFQTKVVDHVGTDGLERAVNIGSMVELEAAVDEERPRVAGVIENRIRIGMRLQIDATVNYARQEWGVLPPNFVRTVESPFNTYLNDGLPPAPIGSPGFASIQAAMNPESHQYLYYVARPNRTHYFSQSYSEHRANINKARQERADL